MKTVLVMIMAMSVTVLAGYTYTYTTGMDFGDLVLNDNESLLVDGGRGHRLDLNNESQAIILNTSPYIGEGNGGIWQISQAGSSTLSISGGEIYRLFTFSYAQAILSGGQIDQIWNYQNATSTKHIEIICRDWEYNMTSKILTGIWGDYSTFNIQLVNVSGYSPTIDNIKFTIIPEPASLLLIGLGGLFLRQRK